MQTWVIPSPSYPVYCQAENACMSVQVCDHAQFDKHVCHIQSHSSCRQSPGVSSQPSPVPDVTVSTTAKPRYAASIATTDRTEQSTATPGLSS